MTCIYEITVYSDCVSKKGSSGGCPMTIGDPRDVAGRLHLSGADKREEPYT